MPIAPSVTTPIPPTPAPEMVTGVDGAKFVKAPVNAETGLSAPLPPTPTPSTPTPAPAPTPEKQGDFLGDFSGIKKKEPTTPTTQKVEPVKDFNLSTGRETEIQDNISKITQASPNLLKDRNAYNQAFGYETADTGKKALLDATFNGQMKPSQDDIFNSLRSGVTV